MSGGCLCHEFSTCYLDVCLFCWAKCRSCSYSIPYLSFFCILTMPPPFFSASTKTDIVFKLQLMCLADLEFDYINPYDSASRINWVVWPEFVAEGVLCFVHLTAGHWIMFLMCLPYLYYNKSVSSSFKYIAYKNWSLEKSDNSCFLLENLLLEMQSTPILSLEYVALKNFVLTDRT